MSEGPYRDPEEALRARRDTLLAERRLRLASLAGEPERLSRIVSRAVGATVLSLGAMVAIGIGGESPAKAWVWLVFAGSAAALAHLVARAIGRRRFRRRVDEALPITGNLRTDIARLERFDPEVWTKEQLEFGMPWAAALSPYAMLVLGGALALLVRASFARFTSSARDMSSSLLGIGFVFLAIDVRRFGRFGEDDFETYRTLVFRFGTGLFLGGGAAVLFEGVLPAQILVPYVYLGGIVTGVTFVLFVWRGWLRRSLAALRGRDTG